MSKLNHTYQNILGFFNFQDIYLNEINKANDGYHFVEIGSLLGKSSAFMGVEIKNSGKKIKFDCVDFWDVRGVKELEKPGDQTGLCYSIDGDDILFVKFNENMKRANVDDIVRTHRMSSTDASKLYEDESLDFVFIDASHEYIDVKADLEHWFPKVKWGRTIAGHDYDWAGVKQAVDEFFGAENIKTSGTSWMYVKDEHTYSIIISYRDRKEHLEILLPILQEKFRTHKYEIIICEQDDNLAFNKSVLYNIGYKESTGNILVFHDVDHIPSSNVNYFKLASDRLDVWYPVKNVIYTDINLQELSIETIPAGYRSHKMQVHDDHFGGVFICRRDVFRKVNGMCPVYKGWGKEDEDIRDRFLHYNYKIIRANQGTFAALQHSDNCPPITDKNFIENINIKNNMYSYLSIGIDNSSTDITKYSAEDILWLKISNIKI